MQRLEWERRLEREAAAAPTPTFAATAAASAAASVRRLLAASAAISRRPHTNATLPTPRAAALPQLAFARAP